MGMQDPGAKAGGPEVGEVKYRRLFSPASLENKEEYFLSGSCER